jgi:hypothetical protein
VLDRGGEAMTKGVNGLMDELKDDDNARFDKLEEGHACLRKEAHAYQA